MTAACLEYQVLDSQLVQTSESHFVPAAMAHQPCPSLARASAALACSRAAVHGSPLTGDRGKIMQSTLFWDGSIYHGSLQKLLGAFAFETRLGHSSMQLHCEALGLGMLLRGFIAA